ncbi:hypothetical protein ACQKWADRAFT_327775 [Trichoderma austrokoningii]
MAEMRKICRTAASTKIHRLVYCYMIERTLVSCWEVRELFRDHAVPSLRLYLQPEILHLPAPPSDWGPSHDPFQPMDTAFFHAVTSPFNRLFIAQFIDYAETKIHVGIPLPLIFTSPATKYEAWKMDKEYKDLQNARTTLERSMQDIEYKSTVARIHASHGVTRRARRLRSRGYGSGLGEVISIDEEWPEEGWASNLSCSPDASYDTRLESKMRDRPFLLENDPTDRSGIIPSSRLPKMLGGSW